MLALLATFAAFQLALRRALSAHSPLIAFPKETVR
jgi:hypothetical protein